MQLQLHDITCIVRMLTTNVLLYLAMNLAGMYTKYLTDRGQRQAFLETHRSMETRQRTQNENNRQEKLLLSGETEFSNSLAKLINDVFFQFNFKFF